MDERFPREDFGIVAAMILDTLNGNDESEHRRVEGFLDALKIMIWKARTDDRNRNFLHYVFHDDSFPPVGFRIYSRLCAMTPCWTADGRPI